MPSISINPSDYNALVQYVVDVGSYSFASPPNETESEIRIVIHDLQENPEMLFVYRGFEKQGADFVTKGVLYAKECVGQRWGEEVEVCSCEGASTLTEDVSLAFLTYIEGFATGC